VSEDVHVVGVNHDAPSHVDPPPLCCASVYLACLRHRTSTHVRYCTSKKQTQIDLVEIEKEGLAVSGENGVSGEEIARLCRTLIAFKQTKGKWRFSSLYKYNDRQAERDAVGADEALARVLSHAMANPPANLATIVNLMAKGGTYKPGGSQEPISVPKIAYLGPATASYVLAVLFPGECGAYSDAGVHEWQRSQAADGAPTAAGKDPGYTTKHIVSFVSSLADSLKANPVCCYCGGEHTLAYTADILWTRGYLRSLPGALGALHDDDDVDAKLDVIRPFLHKEEASARLSVPVYKNEREAERLAGIAETDHKDKKRKR